MTADEPRCGRRGTRGRLRAVLTAALLGAGSFATAQAAPATGTDAEPPELPFSSFFHQPIGPRGLEVDDRLRAADNQRVRLVGYMVSQEHADAGRFLLTPRPVRMSEDADGDADDLPPATVMVVLADGQQRRVVAHQPGLIAVTGRLHVGRHEDAASGRVLWVRLDLDPDALAPIATAASTSATTPPLPPR